MSSVPNGGLWGQKAQQLLKTLEWLLSIDDIEVSAVLNQAAQSIAETLSAEKVEVFIHDRESHTLVALGTSDLSIVEGEQAHELHQLPLANRGRIVLTFLEGGSYITGRADLDAEELRDTTSLEEPGIRSAIIAPIEVNGERRGVLIAACKKSDFFSKSDLHYLEEIARWVSLLFHRAELISQHSQVMAKQAQRVAAEELLTILAHDLRNYLTPLKTRLELVARRAHREDREQDVHDLRIALSSLDRFNRLISDLLDTTRLKQGIFSIRHQPLNLVDLIRETVPAFQTQEIQIHVQTQAQVAMVSADPDRLRQVIENLLSNAIAHAPEQTAVSVTIRTEEHQDRNWVQMIVKNQGPGIPSEMRAQLFEPFVAGSTSKGLGLGLYLASRIAEIHRGYLSVDSPPEGGAAFTLSIPMQT